MFKIVGLLVLAGAGIMWLRQAAANSKAQNASRSLQKDLKKGSIDFDSLAGSLGMMIRSKPMPPGFDIISFNQQLEKLATAKLLEKITIKQVERKGNNSIVIAEAVIKDILPQYSSNREVDIVYPCWICIKMNEAEQRINFTATMPQDKDHQYLLEDLADELYKRCTV